MTALLAIHTRTPQNIIKSSEKLFAQSRVPRASSSTRASIIFASRAQLNVKPVKPLLTTASIPRDVLLDTFTMIPTAIAFQHALLATTPVLRQANVLYVLMGVSYAMEEEPNNAQNARSKPSQLLTILHTTRRPISTNAQPVVQLATMKKTRGLSVLPATIPAKHVTPQLLTVPVVGAQQASSTSCTLMLFVMILALKGSMGKLSVPQPTSAAPAMSNARYAPARPLMSAHLVVLKLRFPTSSNMGPPVVWALVQVANTLIPPSIYVVFVTQVVRHAAGTL